MRRIKLYIGWTLLLTFVGWGQMVSGQGMPKDSLAKQWLDSATVYLRSGDFVKAEQFCLATDSLAREIGLQKAILGANIGLINLHIDNDNYIDSILTDILPIIREVDQPNYWFEYYVDRGQIANLRMQYDRQIVWADSALQVARESGDSLGAGIVYIEMALAYSNIRNFEASEEMGRQALDIFEDIGIQYYIGYGNRMIAGAFAEREEGDSALFYFQRSLESFEAENNLNQVAYTLTSMGRVHLEMGDLEEAEATLMEADKTYDRTGSGNWEVGQNQWYLHMATIYLETNRPELARETALQGIAIADSLELLEDKANLTEVIIRANLMENNLEAHYLDTLLEIRSKEYELGKAKEVLNLREKYLSDERERKIAALTILSQNAELKAQSRLFWLLGGISFVVLAGMVILILFLRARQRTREQMNELNRRALQLQINPHFFFNVLNSINNYISQNDQKAARYYLAKFARLMRLALENSQYDLVPLGNELDLVEAYLKLEQIRRDKFDFRIEVPEDLRDVKVPPLLLQPFVENSVIHAFPDRMPDKGLIRITAIEKENLLTVTVTDNGVGLKKLQGTPKMNEKSSLAIKILRKRLQAFGKKSGSIVFGNTNPDASFPGTLVDINIPVNLPS